MCFRCLSLRHPNKKYKQQARTKCQGNHHVFLHGQDATKVNALLALKDNSCEEQMEEKEESFDDEERLMNPDENDIEYQEDMSLEEAGAQAASLLMKLP